MRGLRLDQRAPREASENGRSKGGAKSFGALAKAKGEKVWPVGNFENN